MSRSFGPRKEHKMWVTGGFVLIMLGVFALLVFFLYPRKSDHQDKWDW